MRLLRAPRTLILCGRPPSPEVEKKPMEIATVCPPLPPHAEEAAWPAMARLPDHLWELVFSFLPVSSLLVSRAVCRLWDAIIRSAPFTSFYPAAAPARRDQLDDLHFLLFAELDGAAPFAAAYRPSRDRWAALPFPSPPCAASVCGLMRVHASGGALVLAEQNEGSLAVYDLFAGVGREIAPMLSLPGQSHAMGFSYALGLIDEGEFGYKIVAVSTLDRILSQVFDSGTRSWAWKGEFLGRFAVLGNSAYFRGILYCLSRAPDLVLAFEPVSGEWSSVDVAMPSPCVVCPHILVHKDSLFLIGAEEEDGEINRIVMWELDDGREKRWVEFGFMPDELLQEFRGQRLNHFYTVDRKGVVCFWNTSSNILLMCDLRGMRWWWPRKCPFPISTGGHSWLGHALEPKLGVARC